MKTIYLIFALSILFTSCDNDSICTKCTRTTKSTSTHPYAGYSEMATDVYEHLRTEDLEDAIKEAVRVTKKYLLIRPHPCLDQRKTLHLTVWSLEEWESFFEKYGLKIIKIGKHGDSAYKNVFLMEIV